MPSAPAAPTNTSPFEMITPRPKSTHAVPSDSLSGPQPPNHQPTPSSSGQHSTQPAISVTPSTIDSADLWELAYEIFRKQDPDLVNDYNKLLLGNGTAVEGIPSRQSVETALKKLLKDREKKQLKISFLGHNIKIRIQVDRLTEFLQWSDPLVKDALSSQPYAALAWSGVSLLLPLLTSSTTQNEAMLDGFNSIGDLQMYWKACEETCLHSEHRQHYQLLIEPLVELYSHIFAYQAHVICHLSKPQHSRALQNLTRPNFWTNKLKAIDELSKNCCKLIDPSREREVQQSRDSQLQELQKLRIIQENILQSNKDDRRDEKETRLLQDLAVAAGDYTRYKNINRHRVDGTCEWFLTDDRFYRWRDSKSSSLLWVSAGPGCGKSVLSKSLIDDRQLVTCVTTFTIMPSSIDAVTSRESTVCYFFFKDGGDGHMDSAHALCALLHQLFTCPSTSGLIKYALESYRNHGATLTRKFSELWRILSDCVMSPDPGEIICVLDALDECKEDSRQEFIKTVKEFYSQSERLSTTSLKLKFLVTSRPYLDLETSFQKFRTTAAYLRFDGDEKSEQIRQEIDLVIDDRLEDITDGFTAEDKRKISKRLKSMDHRTYLWLHLILNIIEQSRPEFGRRSDIEKLLDHLPSQVSDAYEKILSRSTNPSRTSILLRIMLAAARPLTLDEANVALTLAIREQEPALYEEVESDLWPKDNFKGIVTNLCGLFISIYDSRLSFIHQTAKEFLMDSEQGNWKGRFNMPQSHSTISRTCLLHLLLPDIKRPHNDDPTQDEQYPYLAYAAAYWPLHFISQEGKYANTFRRHAGDLCRITERQASIWAPSYLEDRSLGSEGCTNLLLASYLGLKEVVQDIIFEEKSDAAIEVADTNFGQTPLSWAAEGGHEAVVKLLLENGAQIDVEDKEGQTPLSLAANSGYDAVVELLLENGAQIEAKDKQGWTPLSWAAESRKETVVELLLEKGAQIEVKDKQGRTPLLRAAELNNHTVVELLLEKGAQIEVKDEQGRTPLLWAALRGYQAIVKLLLDKGAQIDVTDKQGRTPLSWAAESDDHTVVELLLEKGAQIEVKDEQGRTPLSWAAECGYNAVVKLLLEAGSQIDVKDNDGLTPLLQAAKYGHEAIVELLLESDAQTEVTDNSGQTPLFLAVESGQEAVVKLLLESGTQIEVTDEDGQTPLSHAAWRGHEAVVKLLLQNGSQIDAADKDGWTPLSYAAWRGHEAVVMLLLEAGSQIEVEDNDGQTPLSLAAETGQEAVIKLLIENGSQIEAADKHGRTPLSWAAMEGHEAVIKLLLENNAQIEAAGENGWTPLLWAAAKGHEAVVKLLLENGSQIEATDDNGQTPLSLAAENGKEAVVRLLLHNKADISVESRNGWSPLQVAAINDHHGVEHLLVTYGAPEPEDIYGLRDLFSQ